MPPKVRKAALEGLEAIFMLGTFFVYALNLRIYKMCNERKVAFTRVDIKNFALAPAGPCMSRGALLLDDLQIFFDGCMDKSVAIRKSAMGGLSRLLERFTGDLDLNKVTFEAFPTRL